MQFLSDILDVPVSCPEISEITARGAAFAAGLAVGLWTDLEQLECLLSSMKQWRPKMDAATRNDLVIIIYF
jgi:glycerol kinase